MKKTTLALAMTIAGLTGLTSAVNAALPSNSWYLGGKVGWSRYYHDESGKVATPTTSINKVKKNDIGYGAFLGYQINPYVAAELSYDWLGRLDYKSDGDRVGRLKTHGAALTGKVSYPLSFISNDLDIYGRLGAFIATTKWDNGSSKHGDTNVSPVYALGLDYRLNEDFSTRLEYQWVGNIRNEGPAKPNNALLSLGVTYRLSSPAPAEAVGLELIENRYVLSEDVLFAYNSFDLKPEGQKALNNLVNTLVKLNPSESAIIVIGHTDRIGSQNFNLKLSKERAQKVADYLVAQGVPSNLITAQGVGKSDPVTGDQCKVLKGQELITCLAPDRRVEIEVKALTVEEVEVITTQGK